MGCYLNSASATYLVFYPLNIVMIIGCMLEPSWPIGSFHESLLQYQRHEPPLVQPIPIIGAIHSACIAVSIDILN